MFGWNRSLAGKAGYFNFTLISLATVMDLHAADALAGGKENEDCYEH